MTDIFDRVSVRAIDRFMDLIPNPAANRTLAYQWFAVLLRGEWYKEHKIAMNDDLSVFADQLVCIRIRHKDGVPPEWRVLDVPIIEDINVPVTHFQLEFHSGETEDKLL